VSLQRVGFDAVASLLPAERGGEAEASRLGGRPVLWVAPAGGAVPRTVLYLHGGGYVVGSPRAYRRLAISLAIRCEAAVAVLDYRLAPEHRYPAASADALAAYRELLERGGDPARMSIAGDSAGGGLALATAVAIRDAGLPPPGRLVLMSPWLDLTLSGESVASRAASDPLLSRESLARWAGLYARDRELNDPGCSPLFADLDGLPPILVQVGTDEVLLADSERLAARLGDRIKLEVYPSMWHDFQLFARLLPVAGDAVSSIADFVR
jgi:acetyl esterase/lipase